MTSEVLCPQIAKEEVIITADNYQSLLLSSYERSPGTEVKVRCLSSASHKLVGSDVLTCLDTGTWDRPIPTCVHNSSTNGIIFPGDTTPIPGDLNANNVYHLLPYIIALVVLCLACIIMAILLCVLLRMLRKCHIHQSSSYIVDSSDYSASTREAYSPSTPDNKSQTDTTSTSQWVELATSASRNFRCHELAYSRDSMVESIKYKHLKPEEWSGY